MESNSFSLCLFVCLFPESSSEVEYVTFLPEQTGQLLLCLWRHDINSIKEAAITTCEGSF